jgi:hypothetical protein
MFVFVHVHVLVYGVCFCLYSCCMEMSVLNVHVHDTGLLSMLHVYVHAACLCPCRISMFLLHVHVHVTHPCLFCMPVSLLLYIRVMFMLHVHEACPCPCNVSMFMLHVHVYDHVARPFAICTSMSVLHVYCPCPCPCCISMSMLLVHLHAARLCGLGRLESFWILYATMVQWLPTNNITFGNMILSDLFHQFYQSV